MLNAYKRKKNISVICLDQIKQLQMYANFIYLSLAWGR